MTEAVPHMFADVTAMLEDLHALAVEGQRADYAPDMQSVLNVHLRDGLLALDVVMRAISAATEETQR